MKRICVKKATQFQSAVTGPKIYVYSHLRGRYNYGLQDFYYELCFLFSGHENIYFIENKEKTLRASYYRGTQIFDYMD